MLLSLKEEKRAGILQLGSVNSEFIKYVTYFGEVADPPFSLFSPAWQPVYFSRNVVVIL